MVVDKLTGTLKGKAAMHACASIEQSQGRQMEGMERFEAKPREMTVHQK